MVVNIKYGRDKCIILNPGCTSGSFLLTLKERLANELQVVCHLETTPSTVLDLADLQGNVKNMRMAPKEPASTYLQSGETYILVEVRPVEENDQESDSDEETMPEIVPLLLNCEGLYPNFRLTVRTKTNTPRKSRKVSFVEEQKKSKRGSSLSILRLSRTLANVRKFESQLKQKARQNASGK